jgi:nitrite reductase/ring-hydroxylating ferredoxin subunit
MAVYVKVANAVDLPPGHAIAVTVGDKRLALFSVDGTVVAIDDTCTHRGGPLSEGELKDGIVTCPWHGAQFNVKDGQVLGDARRSRRLSRPHAKPLAPPLRRAPRVRR